MTATISSARDEIASLDVGDVSARTATPPKRSISVAESADGCKLAIYAPRYIDWFTHNILHKIFAPHEDWVATDVESVIQVSPSHMRIIT